jgi:hypothetical protein
MNLVKLSAIVMTVVLVLQSGCDLWCQHAEQITSTTQSHDGAVPPCHGAGESQKDSKHQPVNHGAPKDCLHPQAADDNSKLQKKIVKATYPAAVIEFSGLPIRFEAREFLSGVIAKHDVSRSSPPLSFLRI